MRRLSLALCVGTALLCSLLAPPAAFGAGAGVASHEVTQDPEAVGDYWTPERMRGAIPLEGPVSEQGLPERAGSAAAPTDQETNPSLDTLYPQRVHGKLFVRVGQVNASCSGTLVTAFGQSVVLTAGHCLATPGQQLGQVTYSTSVIFAPGYRNGVAPFGGFPATVLRTPGPWAFEGDISLDIGTANLAPNVSGFAAVALGTRGVTFNRPPNKYRGLTFQVYGYPANPPQFYDSERLILCVSPFIGFEPGTGSPGISSCNQQEGSSGGGWVLNNALVTSIISHGGCPVPSTSCTIVAGTYFGDAAFKVWADAVGGLPKGLRKKIKKCKRAKKAAKKQRCLNKAQTFQPTGG